MLSHFMGVLACCIQVHAISSQLVHRVMSSLLTIVANGMMRMLQEVRSFSPDGALHVRLC